ncbi:MAG: hypothetical protein MJ157_06050 [Clostridia bacterium]|nr:hypothetical protein [Clostridia bacterium]
MSKVQIGDLVTCAGWDVYFKVVSLEPGGYARLKGLNCRVLVRCSVRELNRINLRLARENREQFFRDSEIKIQQVIEQRENFLPQNQT